MTKAWLAAIWLGAASLAAAQDPLDQWPQWRGPRGDGGAPRADPPVEWSETKNIRWKVAIPGMGSATPVVWGGRIFVLTAVDTGRNPDPGKPKPSPSGDPGLSTGAPATLHRFEVLCLDRATGKTLWSRTAAEAVPHEGRHPTNSFASGSPATDGKILVASFGSRGLFAYDLDGSLKWSRNLGTMKIKVGFGEGISPVLHGGLVLVNWDHEGDSFIVALDAATGEEKWRQARDEKTTWSTPFIVEFGGRAQAVVNGTKRTRSYDAATGALLWECGGQGLNAIAMPVSREGLVYCMTGYKGYQLYAIRLDSKGDVTGGAQVAWKRDDAAPYVASPLLMDNLLYYGKERQGILACADAATGELRFGPERLPGIDTLYASLAGAAGKVYVVGREGTTLVLRHGPKFEVLASNRLEEGVDASPVLVGKELYLRGAKSLYRIEAE
ncbi:MAG TPA: PQQ-binding-like beta-propeller repeat protein [Planctomycetota bacterium]|nr:PQQ-binding-like beta-propeller repeat protein [Planctomycetota bacterium]